MTMNERFNADGGFIGIIEWILGARKEQWNAVVSRALFEVDETYAGAK